MYWIKTKYKDWCKTQGIELNRDDIVFLEKMLGKYPVAEQKIIAKEFAMKWKEELRADRNQNRGRRKASCWIREITPK